MKRLAILLLALLTLTACGKTVSASDETHGISINPAPGIQVTNVEYNRNDDGTIDVSIEWAGE